MAHGLTLRRRLSKHRESGMETIQMSRKWKVTAFVFGAIGGPPTLYYLLRGLFAGMALCAQPTANAAHLEKHDALIESKASQACVADLEHEHKADISKVVEKFDSIKDDIAAINTGQGELNGKVDTMLLMMKKGVTP